MGLCALLAALARRSLPPPARSTASRMPRSPRASPPGSSFMPTSATRRRARTSCSRSARRSSTAPARSCAPLRSRLPPCRPAAAAAAGCRAPTRCASAAASPLPSRARRLRARRALIYARVVRRHPVSGQLRRAGSPTPNPRMPYPDLEVVVQYWMYSLVDDWRSTPRTVAAPGRPVASAAGRPPAPRGRLGGDHGRRCRPTSRCSSTGAPTAPASGGPSRARRSSPMPAASAPTRCRGSRSARTPTCRRPRPSARAGGAATRASAAFVHQRVESGDRRRRRGRDRQPARRRARDLDRAGSGAPQAFPLALVNRLPWPMSFPGIWGGRERIEVGPAKRNARLLAADAHAAEALARPARDDLRRRRAQPRS